jgi:hypothetical protein
MEHDLDECLRIAHKQGYSEPILTAAPIHAPIRGVNPYDAGASIADGG